MAAKILVVDDSQTDRMIIRNMLSDFEVLTACDGFEAMRQIDDNPDIDLIILDLNMPNMDGFQVLEALGANSKYKKMQVIILTNHEEIENEIRGLHLGAIDFVRKPLNIESLRVRIEIHLKMQRIQKKIEQDNLMLDSIVKERTAELTEVSAKLLESEKMFRTIFDQAPVGIAIGCDENYISANINNIPSINPMFEKITGRDREALGKISWREITHPDEVPLDVANFEKFRSGENSGYDMEKRYIRPDGTEAWIHMIISAFSIDSNAQATHLCIIEDISNRKGMEKALNESDRSKAMFLSNLPGMAYRCNDDREWTMQFVSEGCYALTGYNADSLLGNKELSFNDMIAPEYREAVWAEYQRVLEQKIPFRLEYEIITASGQRKWVSEHGQGVYDDHGNVEAIEGIIFDITKQKERDEQIQYMSDHDNVTGLNNRRYFEQQLVKMDQEAFFPLSVIMVDIDGLRLINDAFGYSEGDKSIIGISEILKECCRPEYVLARVGGDEFGIIMANTDNETAIMVQNAILDACKAYNAHCRETIYDIHISIGFATKAAHGEKVQDTVKRADAYLRNRKLLSGNSLHSGIISSILATVYEKSQETEEHANRLAALSKKIAGKLNLPLQNIDELELFAKLHDIGKVGVDDGILKKPGKLTENEWIAMKMHAEVGFRIAKSAAELEPIAEYILTHHERWDGNGYPRGLKGEEIPLFSRIVAIADSFDAMTHDRVYRKAMTKHEAVEEIVQNAGTQFDPQIVDIFMEIMRETLT